MHADLVGSACYDLDADERESGGGREGGREGGRGA